MKIVVTGATSFVGLGAVRELLHRGHQVFAVLREHSTKADLLRENGKFPQGLTILEEDLGKLSKLPERIPGGCDVFLHMGWRGAGSDSRKNESVQEESVQDALNAVRVAKYRPFSGSFFSHLVRVLRSPRSRFHHVGQGIFSSSSRLRI